MRTIVKKSIIALILMSFLNQKTFSILLGIYKRKSLIVYGE
jgi:hypothetical protein